VIPVVPKTGPSISLIWLIIATLMIFGWYIYIKRKADI
jgi:LPXTG-motif cell wall-anchored protein